MAALTIANYDTKFLPVSDGLGQVQFTKVKQDLTKKKNTVNTTPTVKSGLNKI